MKKKYFLMIIFTAFLSFATNAYANSVPSVFSAHIYSEARFYADPFTLDDTLFIQAFAYVDVIPCTVRIDNVTDPDPALSNWGGSWSYAGHYLFNKDFAEECYPPPGYNDEWEDKSYTFYVDLDDNAQLDSTSEPYMTIHLLDDYYTEMDAPSNVDISGGFHPTISWDDVDNVYKYRVLLFPIVDDNPYRPELVEMVDGHIIDNDSKTYTCTYTGDAFKEYGTLAVAIESLDEFWQNRSVYYIQHNPILSFFDELVEDGTLEGDGQGKSGNRRLNALRNMLEMADDLINIGDIEGACGQLKAALKKCDGDSPPPDFVAGSAASELNGMIFELMEQLGCK